MCFRGLTCDFWGEKAKNKCKPNKPDPIRRDDKENQGKTKAEADPPRAAKDDTEIKQRSQDSV
jgi:hypothetical protein